MKERRIAERVSLKAAIAVATTLEYLCAEMIEVVGNRLMKDERDVKRIKPRHVTLGIKGDEALMQVMGANAHIAMGGVIPWVEPEVEGKFKRRHVAKAEDTNFHILYAANPDASSMSFRSILNVFPVLLPKENIKGMINPSGILRTFTIFTEEITFCELEAG